jgi:FlaA1/EpsC-like NDP-sugar epimerase
MPNKPSTLADQRTAKAATLLSYRRLLIIACEVVLFALTYCLSFLLRFDLSLDMANRSLIAHTLFFVIAIKLLVFACFGLLSGWWRYVGVHSLIDIAEAACCSTALQFVVIHYMLRPDGYPRSVFPIDLMLTVVIAGGARFAVRVYTETVWQHVKQRRTLIVGANREGSSIARQLREQPALNYSPVAFVDDDISKIGIRIHGVPVLGTTEALGWLVERYEVSCVLIALPSAKGSEIERIVASCRECNVEFKILPPFGQQIGRSDLVGQVRSVRVEDLLGREPVPNDLDNIRAKVWNKTVLVTGAGGSIGSELVRQLATLQPKSLILFERSENDLYKICMELSQTHKNLNYVPVIGDILDVSLLREVFAQHRPQSVLHAAAYKHVPMMEQHCFQAVTNNVFGTYNVALVSRQYKVDDFVLISSDKAVRPTNIMGVTKRVAELIILALQKQHTRFMAVRFGNVLGSSGSVLPLFKQQIASGGPVTVTHPDVERFFMTIPEAVQLVLQALSMGEGGEIFVLDMGEPVRIVDLARNLIRLSGYEPDRDIQVVFSGMRPGEKLYEELHLETEGMLPTAHQKISVINGTHPNFEQVQSWLNELSTHTEVKNVHALVATISNIVPEYKASKEILALCQTDRHDILLPYRRARAALAGEESKAA